MFGRGSCDVWVWLTTSNSLSPKRSQPPSKTIFKDDQKTFLGTRRARIFFMAFETLRLKISGATANNSTASKNRDFIAVTHSDFSYGVKRWRTLRYRFVCMWVKPGVAVCSLNGFLPTASQRVPSIYRKPNFFIGDSVRQSNRKWELQSGCSTLRLRPIPT